LCELEKIIDALAIEYRSLNYIWLLHMAPKSPSGLPFRNKAIEHFKINNHFSKRWYNSPPFWGDDGTIYEITNLHAPLTTNLDSKAIEKHTDDVYVVKAAILSLLSNSDNDHDEIASIIVSALNDATIS
jgi:hypothetical protein